MALELVNKLPYDHPYRWDGTLFGGPKLWRPDELGASLALWLDAEDASTITLNGTTVSQWNDKSGNARHAVQATASDQPTYSTSRINGRPAVFSDGTNDRLNFSSAIIPNNFHIFAVGQPNSNDNQKSFLVNQFAVSTGRLQTWFTRLGSPSAAGFQIGSVPIIVQNDFVLNQTEIIEWARWNNVALVRANGDAFATGDATDEVQNTNTSLFSRDVIFSAVTAGEIILLNQELSTTDRQKLEGYLAWKWGLEANLPADHPYKSTPPTV